MPSSKTYMCPVCGYKGLSEAPRDRDGNPSHEVCPCCSTEFGYDDATKSPAELRKAWLSKGAQWWSKAQKPPKNWNPVMQLRAAKLLEEVISTKRSA